MTKQPEPRFEDYLAVFCLSLSLIVLQVSVTRLLSYRLYYHFVFLSISLTLLGLSAGSVRVAQRSLGDEGDWLRAIRSALSFLILAIPASYFLMTSPPYLPAWRAPEKLMDWAAVYAVGWYSLLTLVLNYVGGIALALVFKRHAKSMGSLYAADLVGAGLGCLLAVLLMKSLSPPVAFVAAGVPLMFPLAFYRKSVPWVAIFGLLPVILVALGPTWTRDFRHGERATSFVKSEWNHLFRTDHFKGMYVLDAGASTPPVSWSEARRVPLLEMPALLMSRSEPEVAIIGPGGGEQVLAARLAKAKSIFAVEINPTIAGWVLNEDRGLNRGLFDAPNITLKVGEGRSALRSSGRSFDTIFIHAIDTYAAAAAGAYALTENFLYTKEAIQDYLETMSPDGILSFSRWLFNPDRETLRVFTTALAALEKFDPVRPESHLVMLAPVTDYNSMRGRRDWGVLLVGKSPFRAEQIEKLKRHVATAGWSILYAPGVEATNPFSEYVKSRDRKRFAADYPFLISPVTDKQPFLFQFYNPLRWDTYQPASWDLNVYKSSALLPLGALVIACGFCWALIGFPLVRAQTAKTLNPSLSLSQMLYFAAIGVGYMSVEVPLTQIFSLYLGHPTYGFTVVLVTLLMATGLGSYLASRTEVPLPRANAAIAFAMAAVSVSIYPLIQSTIGYPDVVRFSAAIAFVGALGVLLGFPLSLGMRSLDHGNPMNVTWAWAVNGAASVIGSCFVMVLLVFFGSDWGFRFSAVCYGMAAITQLGYAPNEFSRARRNRSRRMLKKLRMTVRGVITLLSPN